MAIAGIVLPVHGHALNFGAKSAGDEMPIGFVARHVRTSPQVRHADGDRQSLAGVEQPKIIVFGRPPVADRCEFNEARVGAGLAAWPIVTYRKSSNAAGAFQQNNVTQTLSIRCGDLPGQVETRVNRFSNITGVLPLAAPGSTR